LDALKEDIQNYLHKQIDLFTYMEGIPINYKLFRGNQTDPITYLPVVKEVKKQWLYNK